MNNTSTILIVDDHSPNRKLLQAQLSPQGYNLLEADNGWEALETAQNQKTDLILLDIMMPGIDGFDTCRKLKDDKLTREIPVIFLTALDDQDSKAKGFEAGGVDYVSKPFQPQELLARVQTHLTIRKQTEELNFYTYRLEKIVQDRTKNLKQTTEELQKNYKTQSVINSLLNLSLQNLDLEQILKEAIDLVLTLDWLSLEGKGSIHLYNPKANQLELHAHRNFDSAQQQACSIIPVGRCLCGKAAQKMEMIFESQITENHEHSYAEMQPHGHYCIPIIFSDRLLGILNITVHEGHQSDQREKDFLQAFTNTLAGIIQRHEAEQKLAESEQLYRAIFETTQNPTLIIEEDYTITLANSSFYSLCGYTQQELEGKYQATTFVAQEDLPVIMEYHQQHRKNPEKAPQNYEFRLITRQGEIKNVITTASLIPGSRTVVSLLDITERKKYEEELQKKIFYDPLTELPNRILLQEQLKRAMNRDLKDGELSVAILFLDLDRFKIINESLGHDVGDLLLKAVSEKLNKLTEKQHTVARFGGDEFAILMEKVQDYAEVAYLAEHIQQELNLPILIEGHQIYPSSTVGIVLGSKGYEDPGLMLRDAETAMHRAKVEGKNEIKIFDQNMHKQALKLLHMDSDLRKALENKEFLVFYQPIINLDNLTLSGFEALIRWDHPQKGLVSPAEFIPVAEDTELIVPIGLWVLQQACEQVRKWQTKYQREDLHISVNLSAKQFKQGNLPDQVNDILNASGLPHSSLQLEITESVIMENARTSISMLEQLQSCGPKISIDDFGTGYSSLSYLQRFPINSLKIDRSFVFTLDQGSDNYEFVKTIRTLARNLGLDVIAEGVETKDQLRLLQKLKCEFAQGYYFAKPMGTEAANNFLSQPLPW